MALSSERAFAAFSLVVGLSIATTDATADARRSVRARYQVLPADQHGSPAFDTVRFTRGPVATVGGAAGAWWQLDVLEGAATLYQVRAHTPRDPLAGPLDRAIFQRYLLRVPTTRETFDFRDANTGRALLPAWSGFCAGFLPRPSRATRLESGFPRTCSFLGHVLSLVEIDAEVDVDTAWQPWPDVTVLKLDDELLIGTGRTFKDSEGHRLSQKPQRRNYDYVRWTKADYRAMIDAGFNSFALVPGIEAWLRKQPVFYRRGAAGDAPLAYPADLYRSNYRGNVMFADEPACIMVGDQRVHTKLKWFSDVAELLEKRIRARYLRRARSLEDELRGRGVSFGDLRLAWLDYPVWETRFETACYQLAAGHSGFVHEGRYDFASFYESGASFDAWVKASTGIDRRHEPEEMLRYIYAFLRGAARQHGKHWGISIYGQADPKLSPLAVRLAWDMGARYMWFWTSDHGHHLPFPEQLELARTLRKHARENPRRSIRAKRPLIDNLILLPPGEFLFIESPTGRRNAWDLWWVRELDPAGRNDASQRYRRLVRNAFVEIHGALDRDEEFDIAVDHGGDVSGYRRVVRVHDR